ncbi:hypothetical protein [Olleya sp. HaHaR_3_96]|uniref:hypothetical protein n=1 Tax=Olleya sp. HaHaR_3_96 TaxID=2745560 RepID=UPI001C4FB003|nr:hypothetical protein [Olleya sp. HaHaR_3_96]QXP61162.1 hypothetical protein H0I26_05900 [Olleya sp. HaHaR_3_96]
MKSPLKLSFLFSILLALFSCNDNNDLDETLLIENTIFLKKATTRFSNNNLHKIVEYFYSGNKLTRENLYNNEEELISVLTYTYDNNNRPIRVDGYDQNYNLTSYTLFDYNDNDEFIRYISFDESNMTAQKHDLTYNTSNTVTDNIYVGDYNIQIQNIGENNYIIDDNGNRTTLTTNNYSLTYTYDDKNGLFKNIASKNILNQAHLLNEIIHAGTNNNALSFEYNGNNITDHVDFIYTYNDTNYPISRTEESADFGTSLTTEYVYY